MATMLKFDDEYEYACNCSAAASAPGTAAAAAAGDSLILMDTLWNQSSTTDTEYAFNKYCPYILGTQTHSYVGCTNTMSAQIVYYWIEKKQFTLDLTLTAADTYTTGSGMTINAVNHSLYGYLSFAQTNALLKNFYIGPNHNGDNDDIAALSFAMGVKSEANYGYADGTSTSMLIAHVFKEIGFDSANEINHDLFWTFVSDGSTGTRYSVTDAGWGIIQDNLDNGYVMGVMIYSGETTQHAVAIDGYNSANDTVHLNFGWGADSTKNFDDDVAGFWAGTGWYSRAEFESLQPSYFLADLIGVYKGGAISVSATGVYGVGTLNRVLEQANGMADPATISFSGAVSGSTIKLSRSAFNIQSDLTISDFRSIVVLNAGTEAGYVFRNAAGTADFTFNGRFSGAITINADLAAIAVDADAITVATTFSGQMQVASTSGAARGFNAASNLSINKLTDSVVVSSEALTASALYTGGGFTGEVSGTLIANSLNTAYAIYSTNATVVTVSGGVLFGGSYQTTGSTYAKSARQLSTLLRGFSSSGGAVGTSLVSAASGYAIRSGSGNDLITLSGQALLMGDVYLGSGSDTLVLGSEARIYGDIMAVNLDVTFQLGRISENAIINSDSVSSLTADSTDYTIDLTNATDGTYTLIRSSSSLAGLYSSGKEFTVLYNGVVYSVKASDTFKTYDFIDINVVDGTQLQVTLDNVANRTGGLVITPSTTAVTNQDVILTVKFSDHYEKLNYSFDNSTWQTYTNGVTVEQNGTVYFRLVSSDGSVGSAEYQVSNIDKIPPDAPSISASTTALTKNDVILTAVFADDAVLNEFSRDGEKWSVCNGTVTVNENSTIYFRSFDAAGNFSESNYTVYNIDSAGPSYPVVTVSEDQPTKNNVVVTAQFDKFSIADSYSLNGRLWRSYQEPIVMTRNGVVYFRSMDDDGAVATVKTVISNIDRKPPNAPTVTQKLVKGTSTMVLVSAKFASDSVANEYSLDGGATWQLYTEPLQCYKDTKLAFRSTDAAGNMSKSTKLTVHRKEWNISNLVTETTDDQRTMGSLRWAVARAADGAFDEIEFFGLETSQLNLLTDLEIASDLKISGSTTVTGAGILARNDFEMAGWQLVRDEISPDAAVVGLQMIGGYAPAELISDAFAGLDVTNADGDALGISNDFSTLTGDWGGTLEVTATGSALGVVTEAAARFTVSGAIVADGRASAVGLMAGGTAILTVNGIVAAGNYAPAPGVDVADLIALNQDYADLAALSTGSAFVDGRLDDHGNFTLGGNADTLYFASTARVFGDLVLGGGVNEICIESGAQVFGDVSGDSVAVEFLLKGAGSYNAMLTVDDVAKLLDAGGSLSVDSNLAATGGFVLVAGVSDADLASQSLNVFYKNQTLSLALNQTGVFADGEQGMFTVWNQQLLFLWHDTVAPAAPTVTERKLASGAVVLTAIGAADALSQEFSRDGVIWEEYVDPVEVHENGTLAFRSVDASGNVGESTLYAVNSIDSWSGLFARFSDTLSAANVKDTYKFSRLTAGKYTLTGDFGTLNAKLTIYNADGKKIAGGTVKNGVVKFNTALLEAGNYSVVVERSGKSNGAYTLDMNATRYVQANNADDVWNNGAVNTNAVAIGVLPENQPLALVHDEWVGFGDELDYFRLNVEVDGSYDFLIDNLTAGVKLTVLSISDGRFTRLGAVTVKNGGYGLVTGMDMKADSSYYLLVEALKPQEAQNTWYALEISGTQYLASAASEALGGMEQYAESCRRTSTAAAALTENILENEDRIGMLA